MPRFSLSVPAWLADVLVPPLLLGLFVAFLLGWRHATTPSVTLASFRAAAILTAAYAVGYLAALKLRALLGRAALRRWGGLVTRWTTLALFDLFFTGFVAWSLLRYHAPESALFSATFCAFWGIIGGWIFGPLLLVGVAGFGGVAATASWLWEGDATGAPGAPVPVA